MAGFWICQNQSQNLLQAYSKLDSLQLFLYMNLSYPFHLSVHEIILVQSSIFFASLYLVLIVCFVVFVYVGNLQQESGGTVLSTNWKDIGKQKTECKPPDGMEFKNWEY